MKRKINLLITLLLFAVTIHSQGVQFINTSSFAELKAKAKAANKYIFLDMYATWCNPCKAMDAEVYTSKSVGDYFNDKFISAKIQSDVTSKDSKEVKDWYTDAAALNKQYKIDALPSFLFLSPDGDIIYKATGYKTAEELIKEAQTALTPENQYASWQEQYNAGKREPAFVRNMINKTFSLGKKKEAAAMAAEYMSTLSATDMLTPENLLVIINNTNNSSDKGFSILADHAEEINRIIQKPGFIQGKVGYIVYKEAIFPFQYSNHGKPDLDKMHAALSKFGKAGQDALEQNKLGMVYSNEVEPFLATYSNWTELQQFLGKQDLGNDPGAIVSLIYSFYLYGINTPNATTGMVNSFRQLQTLQPKLITDAILNQAAYQVFLRSNEKTELETALAWEKEAINLNNNPGYVDTYANILFKLDRKDEAIQWEQKAITAIPDNPDFKASMAAMKSGNRPSASKQSLTKENMTGTWKLNPDKTDFGGVVPANAAAMSQTIKFEKTGIILTRSFEVMGTYTDTLTFDGAVKDLQYPDTKAYRKVIVSKDGKIITIRTIYSANRANEEPYNYTRMETYMLTDSKTLLVYRYTTTAAGTEMVKAVYDKQ